MYAVIRRYKGASALFEELSKREQNVRDVITSTHRGHGHVLAKGVERNLESGRVAVVTHSDLAEAQAMQGPFGPLDPPQYLDRDRRSIRHA